MRLLTAFCTFSKARTSICRTRSRETPNSAASSSSVIGSSANRRASKMRRSRSLRTSSAGDQRLVPIIALFALGEDAFLAWCVIDEPILPLAGFAIIADRSVERSVAAKTAVHVDHILFRHAKALGDQLAPDRGAYRLPRARKSCSLPCAG